MSCESFVGFDFGFLDGCVDIKEPLLNMIFQPQHCQLQLCTMLVLIDPITDNSLVEVSLSNKIHLLYIYVFSDN